jgi:hypothetical protein
MGGATCPSTGQKSRKVVHKKQNENLNLPLRVPPSVVRLQVGCSSRRPTVPSRISSTVSGLQKDCLSWKSVTYFCLSRTRREGHLPKSQAESHEPRMAGVALNGTGLCNSICSIHEVFQVAVDRETFWESHLSTGPYEMSTTRNHSRVDVFRAADKQMDTPALLICYHI